MTEPQRSASSGVFLATDTRSAKRLAAVHDRMRQALAGAAVTSELYVWLRYHLGWSEIDGRPCDARRAKGIRPLVCLLSCEATGGSAAQAVDLAAAVELTHEFSLIHDDLEDGDVVRRGRPALWRAVGPAQAINAGDALFCIARATLSAAPLDLAVAADVARRYDAACLALSEGQFLDLSFESAAAVSPAAYVNMVRGKTGALLGLAAAVGARAAGASPAVADQMHAFGEATGVAFQMQDDILGLWGEPIVTGKPAGADLLRGKKSLPVLSALADPLLGRELQAFLAAPERTEERAALLTERMAAAGHRARSEAEAQTWARRALNALDALDLAPLPKAELAALVRAAVARDH